MEVGIYNSESILTLCTYAVLKFQKLTHIFGKSFVKSIYVVSKCINSCFTYNLSSESKFLVFPQCGRVVLYEVLIFTWNLIKVRCMMVINESSRAFMTFARCGRLCSRNSTFNLSKYHMWAKITIILIYFSTAGFYNVALKKRGKRVSFFN